MGRCPNCGTELRSTGEVAGQFGVSGSCIRSALARHPDWLRGHRVGGEWLIPAQAAAQVRPREGGIVLPPATEPVPVKAGACPGCGERFLTVAEATGALAMSPSTLYWLLARHPGRLRAFRVGRRWLIPASGLEAYRARRRLIEDWGEEPEAGDGREQKAEVEVRVKPEVCRCGAYPFPHRKGGGRCQVGQGDERR